MSASRLLKQWAGRPEAARLVVQNARKRGIGITGLALACVTVFSPGAASASTGWSIQPTPNPAGAGFSELKGVSCWSSTACTAVGDYGAGSGPAKTLAERWNGSKWVIQHMPAPRTPNSTLNAVSCPSSTVCFAVGSTNDGARALAERWKANKWVIQRLPRPTAIGRLKGISCSSTKACTAVGYTEGGARTLAERWNGTKWVIQRTPIRARVTSSELNAVSCPAPKTCTAVGDNSYGGGSLAERWNGTKWVIQRTPRPSVSFASQLVPLNGVSCRSSRLCTAVGNYDAGMSTQKTLAERWNGTRWKIQPTPKSTASSETALKGVSCRSSTRCIAVGYRWITSPRVLAEGWNGTKWVTQSAALPAGAIASQLTGVSCVSSTFCIAVGSYTTNRGIEKTLAERYGP